MAAMTCSIIGSRPAAAPLAGPARTRSSSRSAVVAQAARPLWLPCAPRSALAPCAVASPMLLWPGARSRPAARQSLAYALPTPAALVAVLRTGCATAPSGMRSAGRVPSPLSTGTRTTGAPTRPRTWTAGCLATLAGTRSAWVQTLTASSGLLRCATAGQSSSPLPADRLHNTTHQPACRAARSCL